MFFWCYFVVMELGTHAKKLEFLLLLAGESFLKSISR